MLAREAIRNVAARFGANDPNQIRVMEFEMIRMYAALLYTGDTQTNFTENDFPWVNFQFLLANFKN